MEMAALRTIRFNCSKDFADFIDLNTSDNCLGNKIFRECTKSVHQIKKTINQVSGSMCY